MWFWMGEDKKRLTAVLKTWRGRVGLKRVWEFVPKVGKKRNERVKVSSDS